MISSFKITINQDQTYINIQTLLICLAIVPAKVTTEIKYRTYILITTNSWVSQEEKITNIKD